MKMLNIPVEALQHPSLLHSDTWRSLTRPSACCSARWPISCRRSTAAFEIVVIGGSARIANEAGFAKRNINDVLASLTASGVIKAAWAGNERHFTAYRERWALLLDIAGPADPLPIRLTVVSSPASSSKNASVRSSSSGAMSARKGFWARGPSSDEM
jgi:hypothetical protein